MIRFVPILIFVSTTEPSGISKVSELAQPFLEAFIKIDSQNANFLRLSGGIFYRVDRHLLLTEYLMSCQESMLDNSTFHIRATKIAYTMEISEHNTGFDFILASLLFFIIFMMEMINLDSRLGNTVL